MFRSPRLGYCASRSKPGARSCRGNAVSFSPSRHTTLNGTLRIGLSAQKVRFPDRKPAPLLDSSREYSSCATTTSSGTAHSFCAAAPTPAAFGQDRAANCVLQRRASLAAPDVARRSPSGSHTRPPSAELFRSLLAQFQNSAAPPVLPESQKLRLP